MKIYYNAKTDVLYLRLDDKKQPVLNKRIAEDVVLDMGKNSRIVGIEVLGASKRLDLSKLFPVQYEMTPERA
jgi:uncharacterized protein YuzE